MREKSGVCSFMHVCAYVNTGIMRRRKYENSAEVRICEIVFSMGKMRRRNYICLYVHMRKTKYAITKRSIRITKRRF